MNLIFILLFPEYMFIQLKIPLPLILLTIYYFICYFLITPTLLQIIRSNFNLATYLL